MRKRLPKEFMENIYQMFTPLMVDKIISGMMVDRYTTLRVNTIKYNSQDFMQYCKKYNIKYERTLWYKDGFIIKNKKEKEIQKLDIYQKGYIYLQSLSSMIPPLILSPKSGDNVLDLTAAPGSKTTQLAAIMKNKGYILANELDKIRCERLKYNINTQGANIVEVINNRGEKIGEEFKEKFDKVLLDAPCSGEGRFSAKSIMSYRNWSLKTVKELSKLQKKLIKSAYTALKPGGIMVYSTCTLNKEENEFVLDWAINNLNVKLIDFNINLNLKNQISGFTENINKDISKSFRILPTKEMEGFFIAKLKKYN